MCKVKICGITDQDAASSAVRSGADFLGFVFYPNSPRHVTASQAYNIKSALPSHIKTVAVTVDASQKELDMIVKELKPDILQLHGKETPEHIQGLKKRYFLPIIKSAAVFSGDDIANARIYEKYADYLLFDAKPPKNGLPGGNGLAFDWHLLEHRNFNIPWFLSGGLGHDNIIEALSITRAPMVDVSSSLEITPGKKDPELVRTFIEKVKQHAV